MKKLLLMMVTLCLTISVSAQEEKRKPFILPGKAKINVESLKTKLPLNIDVNSLSLSEVRILRNAIAARQGYLFMSSDLRGVFASTTWYESIAEDRLDKEQNGMATPIKYTPAEQAFVKRLQARENELKAQNNKVPAGMMTNMDNIVNPFSLSDFDPQLYKAIAKNGFAIVPANENQLFQIYENNDYREFPSFVTTDLYLQAFHMFFDCLLKETEQEKLSPMVTDFVKRNYELLTKMAANTADKKVKEAAEYCAAYYAIAYELNEGEPLPVAAKYTALVKEEIKHVNDAESCPSEFLRYTVAYQRPAFPYALYRPRGHYTRSETLQRYFRTMMWLQNVPFEMENDEELRYALLMAETICQDASLSKMYQNLTEPITYLMGLPDDVSITQVYKEQKAFGTVQQIFNSKKNMEQVCKALMKITDQQTRIKPKFAVTSPYKVRLMPQRYMPDAEVLQEMVDYESNPTLRAVPTGLDVMAAIGIPAAERILIQELKEQENWNQFTPNLLRMKQRMGTIDWDQTVANKWIASLKDVNSKNANYPRFMQTPQWDKKNLNAALASWAELKHDAILYAKQPFGAECGGGGLPEPYTRGYVEPNVAYWTKAIHLIDATMDVLKKFDLVTEKATTTSRDLREQAEFLLSCSEKELAGKKLSEQEYRQIEAIGSVFENITLDLVREPDQELYGWYNVQGADKSVAVVADVYTANSFNNPNKSVLYEAVGPAHQIYVVVEIEGYLYLTRGAVFSYREFEDDLQAPRHTDEEWQQELESQPNKGIPSWMEEIIVPLGGKKLDNEYIFYSSGC